MKSLENIRFFQNWTIKEGAKAIFLKKFSQKREKFEVLSKKTQKSSLLHPNQISTVNPNSKRTKISLKFHDNPFEKP